MNISVTQSANQQIDNQSRLFILLGLLVLYAPSYWDLANGIWQKDEQLHGPMIALVSGGLLWQLYKKNLALHTHTIGSGIAAISLLTLGLLAYILGRSQEILLFEVGSQIPVLAGILLIMHGTQSLRLAWFPLLYLIFMLPLPGIIIDTLTGPLKQWISAAVEQLLYSAGYPIARQGVILMIGRYQLMIADACSGLNSMFSLAALGSLFIYLVHRSGKLFNGIMLASILPIAFVANMIRVIALVLITYYWGDEAGQGFLHGFAGLVLFFSALGGFLLLDVILGYILPQQNSHTAKTPGH